MPKLIKDKAIVENAWHWLAVNDEDAAPTVPAGQVIVPLQLWLAQRDALSARQDIGVYLKNDENPEDLKNDVGSLPLIAIEFPGFMDGRGFTLGRLLRERYGFTGELRAAGGFIRDQLTYLSRCGFNAFDCNETFDLDSALSSLNDLPEYYQAAADQELPLFRRRD